MRRRPSCSLPPPRGWAGRMLSFSIDKAGLSAKLS